MKRICMLKPMKAEYSAIGLLQGRNIVGRTKDTGIQDTKCSKQQVELNVDMDNCEIKCKVIGVNPCGINGLMTLQKTECILEHGDVLEIVYGKHPFEVIFKPPPANEAPEKMEVDVKKERTTVKEKRNMSYEEFARAESPKRKEQKIEIASTEEDEEQGTAATASWDSVENGNVLIFTSAGVKASNKIAAYDIDGTIIKTKSGNVFPKSTDDWMLYLPKVPEKLKTLSNDGFKIVFFTNQGGIGKGKVNVNEFKEKIKLIQQKIGVPVQVFIATSYGYYRKPAPGMWEQLTEHKNNGVKISKELSFFVGDAAGRPEVGKGATKRRKDHSLVDRLFAKNVGIVFYTPEEHFLGARKEEWIKPEYNPCIDCDNLSLFEPRSTKIPAEECEIIIMVGLPGSGKSSFCQKYLFTQGYKIANADTLGSTQACLKLCEKSIAANQSIVVDNTNVDQESRKKFIELAKANKLQCRCFMMNVTLAQIKHNLAYRNLTDKKHSKVNDMVFNMMKKKLTPPTLDEGFQSIVKVNLIPEFENDEDKRLYKLYLAEK